MLIRTVAVCMDEPFALKYLDEGLELDVPARWDLRFLGAKVIPCLLIIAGSDECVAHHLERTHASSRIPRRLSGLERLARTLWILAHRKLDPGRRVEDQKSFDRFTVLELHRRVLATDRIRRAMQQIRRGNSARECSIN